MKLGGRAWLWGLKVLGPKPPSGFDSGQVRDPQGELTFLFCKLGTRATTPWGYEEVKNDSAGHFIVRIQWTSPELLQSSALLCDTPDPPVIPASSRHHAKLQGQWLCIWLRGPKV